MYKKCQKIFNVATVLAGAFEAAIPSKSPETKGHRKMDRKLQKVSQKLTKVGTKTGPKFVNIPLPKNVKNSIFFANSAKNSASPSKFSRSR